MQAESKVTTPESNSPDSIPKQKTIGPRFVVCGMLDAIESGAAASWDDTDWLDYVSQYADTGVRS